MASKALGNNHVILILSVIFVISITGTLGFNITRLLNNHRDFSTFNDFLSKTGVANAINTRKTITVLVVDNEDLDGLQDKPQASIRNILATHVLLDYYDIMKFADLDQNTALITNLFQSSGYANKEQGYINVTTFGGEVVFGSGVKGSRHDSKMVRSVAAQPYTISVIQISKPIVAPGLDQNAPTGSSSSPIESPAPMAAPSWKKTEGEDDYDESEEIEGPAAEVPEAEAPAEDVENVPSSAPAPAPGPASKEATPADEPKMAETNNSAVRRVARVGVMVTCLLGLVSLGF